MSKDRVYSEPGDRIVARQPVVEVHRYRGLTRLNHWITAILLILLLVSGLALFHPSLYGLTALFGGGQTTRWLHPFLGVALVISFTILALQLWKLNLIRREDITWAKNLDAVMKGEEERLPEVGKYNLGQKFIYWSMVFLILLLIATGIPIWYQYFPDVVTTETRRVMLLTHSIAAVLIILVFILHVYAAFWTKGTIRAMTRGTVTGGWAFRHHRKWLRELAGRQRVDPAE
ncbi:formate dehydrogenase subunit gamma [Paracoccus sp. S-4012]|uniref:formate dehydrogenase subunit gamma n=1 Tax=Paracoccus sp. S-4012 TaxID=2665648 RepID=UPI0012AFAFD7|nr:formate dehydrogenase subunit gamma [Paracoccus sp. S-4012]MRX49849.1 formate dehydrogenase subunit gamma [Paracoccus sp. S-4012]